MSTSELGAITPFWGVNVEDFWSICDRDGNESVLFHFPRSDAFLKFIPVIKKTLYMPKTPLKKPNFRTHIA